VTINEKNAKLSKMDHIGAA